MAARERGWRDLIATGALVGAAGIFLALMGFGVISGFPLTGSGKAVIMGLIGIMIGIGTAFAGWRKRKV